MATDIVPLREPGLHVAQRVNYHRLAVFMPFFEGGEIQGFGPAGHGSS